MCPCIDKVTKDLQEKLKKEKDDVYEWEDEGSFQNVTIRTGNVKTVTLPFRYSYTRRKNSGEPEKKLTNNSFEVMMSFCPFCGSKIE